MGVWEYGCMGVEPGCPTPTHPHTHTPTPTPTPTPTHPHPHTPTHPHTHTPDVLSPQSGDARVAGGDQRSGADPPPDAPDPPPDAAPNGPLSPAFARQAEPSLPVATADPSPAADCGAVGARARL